MDGRVLAVAALATVGMVVFGPTTNAAGAPAGSNTPAEKTHTADQPNSSSDPGPAPAVAATAASGGTPPESEETTAAARPRAQADRESVEETSQADQRAPTVPASSGSSVAPSETSSTSSAEDVAAAETVSSTDNVDAVPVASSSDAGTTMTAAPAESDGESAPTGMAPSDEDVCIAVYPPPPGCADGLVVMLTVALHHGWQSVIEAMAHVQVAD